MEKFLFNNNIFDDAEGLPAPDTEDIDQEAAHEDIPLPPMFSEEELQKACQDAFEKGRQDGIKEIKSTNEAHSSELLAKLIELINQKTDQDKKAVNNIHTQSLRLALAMFEKTLPILQNQYGLDNLKANIESILQANAHESDIVIYVHPDMLEPFGPYIAELKKQNAELHCDLKDDERLSLYGCNIAWKNGGGQIDQMAIADKVMHIVNQILAGAGIKGDDSTKNVDIPTSDDETADNDEIRVSENEDGEAT